MSKIINSNSKGQLDNYVDNHYDDQINLSKEQKAHNALVTFTLPYRFIQLSLILFIGIGVGYLYFIVFTSYANNCSLAYVSNDEIIALEKQRISNQPDNEDKKLFFGKTEESLMLIDSIAKTYESKNTKIIFVNDKFVRGRDVFSISKQVHSALIDVLSKEESKQLSKRENTNNFKDDLIK